MTDELLDILYDTPALYLSLVVNMFKFMGYSNDTDEILKICTTNRNYMYEYKWTKEQRSEYEKQVEKILRHCFNMDDEQVEREIDVFNAFGGAFSLDKYE